MNGFLCTAKDSNQVYFIMKKKNCMEETRPNTIFTLDTFLH